MVGLQGVFSRIWASARRGEDLRKLMFFQRPRFFKTRLRLVGCSNLHSAFPQAHWVRKSTWFRTKSLQSLTGRISKNFWIFQKSHHNSGGSCVRWKRRIQPKIDQQILGTRRFTKMNTVLSCALSTQFHLCTDVRYHYVPKCTVFHVFFKIAVHWKKLASSNSLQQRKN